MRSLSWPAARYWVKPFSIPFCRRMVVPRVSSNLMLASRIRSLLTMLKDKLLNLGKSRFGSSLTRSDLNSNPSNPFKDTVLTAISCVKSAQFFSNLAVNSSDAKARKFLYVPLSSASSVLLSSARLISAKYASTFKRKSTVIVLPSMRMSAMFGITS